MAVYKLNESMSDSLKNYIRKNLRDHKDEYETPDELADNVFYDSIEQIDRRDWQEMFPEDSQQAVMNSARNYAYDVARDIMFESLTEDTVKKANGKWTNRGDDGTEHGEFDTKKKADAQRRAMFAQGWKKESLELDLEKVVYDKK